ncbi:hypothetical protein JOC78_002681 [Bacillus ectoiniformans]|uniref:DUF3951 domain-containing protein n=1 Tax=Bacillus ectoiniformans TaxID=1494429 RepID=UPI00195EB740|nr:DUF3951 domain-containing protein [Bacillus ectoiniformans]MBM7649707.1 hypothetical protein [Bacillus ectoiniformans]
MEYLFPLLIVFLVGFVCYRMFKKKSLPSNEFTPYDDLTMQNTKSKITEEENEKDKTV